MIPVVIKRDSVVPKPTPSSAFKYVDQGNYATIALINSDDIGILYSDSATSCIIVAAVGVLADGTAGMSLAHLDSEACIAEFARILREQYPTPRGLQLYAQGANPPDNPTSIANAKALRDAVASMSDLIADVRLFLQEGDPREHNLGDFGIQVPLGGDITVTSQPYALELTDRDPTCGCQTIYCIMRRQQDPPVQLRDAMRPFDLDEVVELAEIALKYRKDPSDPTTAFTNIINMQSEDVRNQWSTTPQYEAPWFADELKQAACFALSISPTVQLCAPSLADQSRRYLSMHDALLGTERALSLVP